ncbi:hypothetical protein [Paraburkholderia sp. J67]|uniref:hypothetical protein n=1 Tax=Paraburkholderia sp. J67 TaxID=2805435 RepID=UPI002ABDBC90|nr:hypothetical protein [Paraburkholderia sp. J67]
METTQSDGRPTASSVTAAIAMERLQQAGLQTDAPAGAAPASSIPKLNDAFELLHENVRLANDEFAMLFKMLEPHLPRHLFNTGAHVAPTLDSETIKGFDSHPSRGPEYSPTYSKVVNAAEAINRMRRGIEQITKHLIV